MKEHILVVTLLLGLWTAGWLHWFFAGEIRNFIAARLFPKNWRAGLSRTEIFHMDRQEFDLFLASDCLAPGFIRGVLGCPGCLSAHIAFLGALLTLPAFQTHLLHLPFLWAAGAWIGHRLHAYVRK